jgi:uncharacterized paraquat-inducible protein A
MISANCARRLYQESEQEYKVSRQIALEKICAEIAARITRAAKEHCKYCTYSFDVKYTQKTQIYWGFTIKEIMKYFQTNGYKVKIIDKQTLELQISWVNKSWWSKILDWLDGQHVWN